MSAPGRSAFRWPRIPSRVYWIDNHRTRHESTASSEVGGLARRAARSKAAFDKPKTLGDHRLLGLRSSQLRNRIHLIQLNSPAANRSRNTRQILQPAGHPDQLRRSRMSQTKPGRNPLRKIRAPHPPGTVDPDPPPNPLTSRRQRRRRSAQENGRFPHQPDHSNTPSPYPERIGNRSDRNRSETGHPQGKSRNF